MSSPEPLRFCFGLHLHQPVGNFDSVFEEHLAAVYQPLLDGLERHQTGPVSLHLSGPLLDWLEGHASSWVDQLGTAVADGTIELLAAGYDEPILVAWSPEDRVEQVLRHRERMQDRFGAPATTLWLTERVWESDLPRDLAKAGIEVALVDDHHLRLAGISGPDLHRPVATKFQDGTINLLGIDEQLRYLVPFRPVEELATYLRECQSAGNGIALLADDGEKFGGWPGTAKWVWEDGWFGRFADTLHSLTDEGVIQLSTVADAVASAESIGPVEVPSASYPEMERWALPPEVGRRLNERGDSGESLDLMTIERGQWRDFFDRYPESRRLQSVVNWLSELCRVEGNNPEIRGHIGRAQCNDAYWHGVFGGAYLSFLRAALWKEVAVVARLLAARGSQLTASVDIDEDGTDEIVILTDAALTVIAPHRGGVVEVHLDFATGVNQCDVMARHEEAYHPAADDLQPPDQATEATGGSVADAGDARPSIHDLEDSLDTRPPLDAEPRALFVDRWIGAQLGRDDFVSGEVPPSIQYGQHSLQTDGDGSVVVTLVGEGIGKVIAVGVDGSLNVEWDWESNRQDRLTTELSSPKPMAEISSTGERWDYPIETVEKREDGFAESTQGAAVVLRWGGDRKHAEVKLEFSKS